MGASNLTQQRSKTAMEKLIQLIRYLMRKPSHIRVNGRDYYRI